MLFGTEVDLHVSGDCVTQSAHHHDTRNTYVSRPVGGRLVAVPWPMTCLTLMIAAGLVECVKAGDRSR